MASESGDWPLLSVVLGRPNSDAVTAAQAIIGRGGIPVTAVRSDIPRSTTPERVEGLLMKAKETQVWFGLGEITAYYRGDEDRHSILGPRSNLEIGPRIVTPPRSRTDWAITFSNCRVHWPSLAKALIEAGYRLRKQRPGPKDGEKSVKDLACEIALQILDDEAQRPNLGYGRLAAVARTVNAELAGRGYQYLDNSIVKMIRPSLRDWETRNPQK
jgi:hypothetical protein